VLFVLPAATQLTGVVVDRHRVPVASAEIWLAAAGVLDDGVVVGHSGADGSFEVRDVPAGRYLSAFAQGHEPALLQQVPAAASAPDRPADPVVLQMPRAAGFLSVLVMDAAGAAVADATVQIGAALMPAPVNAQHACNLQPPWTGRTDTSGRVRCTCLPLGRVRRLWARAPSHAGGATPVLATMSPPFSATVQLPRSTSLSGQVELPSGDLRQHVVVAARALRSSAGLAVEPGWLTASCLTGDDGTYLLSGVPARSVLLRALAYDKRFAETEFDLSAAAPVTWSPTLGRGGTITGWVRTAAGQPLPGLRVEADAVLSRRVTAVTAEDGSFALPGLGDRAYEIVVRPNHARAVLLRSSGHRHGQPIDLAVSDEAVPTAFVCGRVLDRHGVALRRVALLHAHVEAEWPGICDEDGSFRIGPVPAGQYHLLAGGNPFVIRREVDALAGEHIDLGTLLGGIPVQLEVELVGTPSGDPQLSVATEDGAVLVAWARLRNGRATVAAPPGRYRVEVTTDGATVAHGKVVLRDNARASLRLVVPDVGQVVRLGGEPT